MREQDKIWREGLKPLSGDAMEAGPEVESRLLREFRKQYPAHKPAGRKLWWAAACAAIAVAIWIGAAVIPRAPRKAPGAVVARAPVVTSAAPLPAAARPAPTAAKRVSKRALRQSRRLVETTFYPLPYAELPVESAQVFRVTVPRSAMSVAGFPVNPERMLEPVLADVMVGEDGAARAIRFVQ
jgi:hypothetical protein